ncbi:putative ferric-chelate reductase 1 homolog isoform X2 [Leptidea sinapis]|uniref:putative ferric-chelate reductase 1 homolog isoform X2 n=1 Tax=Leptidea sinapis TaxID=189913 RepID=UPI002131245F|nr:putative ferric-chelate reductase 1 homolog isoform X2 [Leptidea sinapis]
MLPRKRSTKLLLIAVLCLVQSSEQHGSGAPPGACLDQIPRHSTILPQASVPPYAIITSSAQVRQGDALNVTIGSPFTTPLPIGGFILQARSIQDTDKIIGKFTGVPTVAQIMSCRGDNDTVTHTSPQEKPPLTFTWVAPNDYLGGVEFRATVAQSYATFWKNVESTLVEVVTPDTVITTSSPVTTTARTTQAPPVIMESKPNTTPPPLDSIYQGCADTKLCFGVPQNCIPTGNCKAIVAIFVAGDIYTFEIQGTDNPKYVSAALSMDNKMGDDSAMECVRNDNGRVNLFTSWTYPKVEPYVKRSDSPQDIVQLLESSTIDGKLYCKFRRDTVSKVMGQTFDLARNKYNLMVVSGDSMKDADRVGFHSLAFEATGEPLALSTVGTAAASSKLLLKLHGSFMIAAWIGTASLGILLARYFRKTWVGKTFGGKDIWFAYHRILMVVTWLLTVAGFILIVVEVGGWTGTGDNPHAITGIVTVVLTFIQPIGAYFRPHPGTNKRPIFNWAHWFLGNSAHILGIATIFLSVYLQKAELPSWSVYVLAAFVVFHVIMHVVLSFSGFKKHLLGIYAPIILLFVVAMICLVAFAPFGATFNP